MLTVPVFLSCSLHLRPCLGFHPLEHGDRAFQVDERSGWQAPSPVPPVFSIVQSVRPGPSDGTGLPVSSLFIARTERTIPFRPSLISDGTKYNLHRPSNLWTGTDGGRLPRHREIGDISRTQLDLSYLIIKAAISIGSLAEAALSGCGRGASLRQSKTRGNPHPPSATT